MFLGFNVQGSHKPPRRRFLGCARFPLDRFVSRDTRRNLPGKLVTPLVRLGAEIEELQLNADVIQGGEIRVQLRGADGRIVHGYALEDCEEIYGDELARVVRWKKGTDVSALAGKTVRLKVFLRDGDLYSFRFR